ncbi:hypothetical protein [Streptomyces sp. NRRL F-525]|uniref:hypothetical protein n=1 Tax=Streptomyces sp. NRRL F-525 TaxID=1463861 RepID=UPI0005240C23|nr:hypothetical protein [Streptomyces sp. NRRL F-525]
MSANHAHLNRSTFAVSWSAFANSIRKARLLDERAPVDTVRVVTDGRSVVDVAADVPAATGWVNRA